MIRPFLVIGLSYLIVLMLLSLVGNLPYNLLILILVFLFIFSLCIKRARNAKVIPTVILLSILAVISYSYKISKFISISEKFNDTDINVSGTLCDLPYKSNSKFHYIINANILENDSSIYKNVKIKFSSSECLNVDNLENIDCTLHTFAPKKNGLLSQRDHLFSKGIKLTGYIVNSNQCCVSKNQETLSLNKFILKFRKMMSEAIRKLLPRDLSSIAIGMLLGDKTSMNESIKYKFREIGVSHLLSVSGLHTAVIAKMLQIIFIMFKINKRFSSLFSCLGIFLFMCITGFSPSVVRAGIMAIIFFLGESINLKSDSLNSLGLAVFIILIINPFSAGDVSMLLSFFATLGIILFEKSIRQKIILPKFISSTASVTISSMILTLPIIMIVFGRISLISIIANFFLVIPSMIMIPCILIASIFSLAPLLSFISYPLTLVSAIILRYIIWCSTLLSKLPFSSVNISQPNILLWLIFSLFLFAVTFLFKHNIQTLKASTLSCLIILLVSILSSKIANLNTTSLAIIDVGKGCSTVLSKNGHIAILTCGGEKYNFKKLYEYLDKQNINSIDYMMVSNYKDSSCSYSDNLLNQYKISTLLFLDNDKFDEKITQSLTSNKPTYFFNKKVKANLWGNVKINTVSHKNKSFITLNVNHIKILICPSGGDIDLLEKRSCVYDFFITQDLPSNYKKIQSTYSIISSNHSQTEKNINKLAKISRSPFSTSTSGNIILDFIKDNIISIRREL